MELKKINENVTRTFDAEGEATERVENISYEVRDNGGTVIGNASVGNGYANLNVNLYGMDSIEEGETALKELLGVEK
ncbi:MAG: hypothetical protein HDS62_07615 [Bacteroidales bacterium]|nr:hypothetical protein [Bacteroidales bacterium]